MGRRARTLTFLALSATMSLTTSRSGAQAPSAEVTADAALQRGIALRKEQRDQEALDEFRRAYALSPSPRARAQMALAEQALGHWLDADAGLGAALDAKEDAWIERNRASLEAARVAVGRHV